MLLNNHLKSTAQTGTKPKVVITRLTVSMSLSRYTAPSTASRVALVVTAEAILPCDGFLLIKASRPV